VDLYREATPAPASDTNVVTVRFRHTGLASRSLVAASPNRYLDERTSGEDLVEATVTASLAEIESDLVGQVKRVIDPLFAVFESFELSDEVSERSWMGSSRRCAKPGRPTPRGVFRYSPALY
jgi:hypothetical protein